MNTKSFGISLVIVTTLSVGFTGCGSSGSDTPVVNETNSTIIDDSTPTVDTPIGTKEYYGIRMYEEPDNTFTHVLTTGSYSIYNKSDDYWDSISVITIENQGIVKVSLLKTFYSDEYGTRAKSDYNDLKPSLDSKYTLDNEFDFCSGSSYVCEASNYAYSIYRSERFKSSWYYNEEDTISLQLDDSTGSIYDIDLKVGYETKEFSDFKDDETNDVADNL